MDELWCTDHRSFLLTSSASCLSTLAPILDKSTFYSVSIEHLIKGEEYSEGNSWALLFSLQRFESPAGRGRKLGPNLTHRSAKPGLVSTTAPRRQPIDSRKVQHHASQAQTATTHALSVHPLGHTHLSPPTSRLALRLQRRSHAPPSARVFPTRDGYSTSGDSTFDTWHLQLPAAAVAVGEW